MFTILLLTICCISLTLTATIDQQSKGDSQQEGKQITLKLSGLTYRQYLTNHGQCTVELTDENGKFHQLTEGEIIPIKRKWYKVEDCRLNRAYIAACGSDLFYQMLDVVCSYVNDDHYPSAKRNLQRRQTNGDLISVLDQSFYGVCCQSACTIPELARHCTPKW